MMVKFIGKIALLVCGILTLMSCNNGRNGSAPSENTEQKEVAVKPRTTVRVIVYDDFNEQLADKTIASLRHVFDNVIVTTDIKIPATAYYQARNRYKAHLVIDWEREAYPNYNEVLVGFTRYDVSTKVHGHEDYGVMGLTLTKKKGAVISTFRLHKNQQESEFLKLALHELGHAFGLPHCKHSETCYMRDANQANHFPELTDFCPSCKTFLQKKGWHLR